MASQHIWSNGCSHKIIAVLDVVVGPRNQEVYTELLLSGFFIVFTYWQKSCQIKATICIAIRQTLWIASEVCFSSFPAYQRFSDISLLFGKGPLTLATRVGVPWARLRYQSLCRLHFTNYGQYEPKGKLNIRWIASIGVHVGCGRSGQETRHPWDSRNPI